MSSMEKSLRDAGAQCVGGDLILGREVLGHYRNGQLILTVAGAAALEDLAGKKNEEILAVARAAVADADDPDVGELEIPTETRRRRGRNAE